MSEPEGLLLHQWPHTLSWDGDGGPEKGPFMLDVSISLYFQMYHLLETFKDYKSSKQVQNIVM